MPNFVKKLAPSFFPVALLKGRRLIDRQQRNCKRVESLSQKTKTYAAFIRQPTMNAPPSPLTNPPKGALEVSEGVWHIVNAHSTLCHFVLMACLPHSFYIKPARDSGLIWGDGGSQPLASYFGFNFLFFFFCSGWGEQITKQKAHNAVKGNAGDKESAKNQQQNVGTENIYTHFKGIQKRKFNVVNLCLGWFVKIILLKLYSIHLVSNNCSISFNKAKIIISQ